MLIRPETALDVSIIEALLTSAFEGHPHSNGEEGAIVENLHGAGALAVSLVAVDAPGVVVGHVAFSPVAIDGHDSGWYGLGPVAVAPAWQRQGVGSALIQSGLNQVRSLGGLGCVVLGDPGYYLRFGFEQHGGLLLPGVPAEYFLAMAFDGAVPSGTVTYHEAFSAIGERD